MIPESMLYKLQNFEQRFSDKSSIKFADAKKYLFEIVGKEINDEYIKQFLKTKGYQIIEEIKAEEDDLDLDQILNLDWSPKKSIDAKIDHQGYVQNLRLLKTFNTGEGEGVFEQLVIDNMRLVHKFASRYQNYVNHQLSYDDLVSEGTIGLIKAIRKFDLNKEVQFSTYAVWWIRQQILRSIIDTGTTIRIPVHMFESVMKVKRAESSFILNGQSPNVMDICEQINMSLGAYEKAKVVEHQYLGITSINQFASTEEQETEIGEFICYESSRIVGSYNEQYFNPALLAEQKDVRYRILQVISELKPREQEIILERFGFLDNDPKTLEQIGQRFELTRERIRQIEAKAIGKLKAKMTSKAVREDFQWPEQMIGG